MEKTEKNIGVTDLSKFKGIRPVYFPGLKRYGNLGDGGYVIPEGILARTNTLLSFGISEDWSFESDLALNFPNLEIFAYDFTVDKKRFRRHFITQIRKFATFNGSAKKVKENWLKYRGFIKFCSMATFSKSRLRNRIDDKSIDVTLTNLFKGFQSKNLGLKIDIEGDEYRVIDEICSHENQILWIAFEFHYTDHLRLVFNDSMAKLQKHFYIAHFHANNCVGLSNDGLPESIELTLINKSINPDLGTAPREYPLTGIDYPNNSDREDFRFDFGPA